MSFPKTPQKVPFNVHRDGKENVKQCASGACIVPPILTLLPLRRLDLAKAAKIRLTFVELCCVESQKLRDLSHDHGNHRKSLATQLSDSSSSWF